MVLGYKLDVINEAKALKLDVTLADPAEEDDRSGGGSGSLITRMVQFN